jgi:hypothetical protein
MRNRSLRRILVVAGVGLAGLALGSVVAPARAGTITYVTPPGATVPDGAVRAEATFTTNAGALTITLKDLLANPKSAGQLLSDLVFTVGNGSLTGASLSSSSGQEITVNKNGTFTLGSTVAAGWVYTTSGGGTTGTLDVLSGPGHAGPAHLIIGPPGPGGTYSNANGSIAGNGPHNPFLNQTATFTIDGAGITAATTITSATFSFGTTSGIFVHGQVVPEPSSLILSLCGLGLVGSIGIYRSRRRRQTVAA